VAKSLTGPAAAERLKALSEVYAALPAWDCASLEASLKETAAKLAIKTGELVHPARVAASGRGIGPGLYEMLEILGKERTLARFSKGIAKAGA
jgi:glutamyl-tRNA synthetase